MAGLQSLLQNLNVNVDVRQTDRIIHWAGIALQFSQLKLLLKVVWNNSFETIKSLI